MQPGTLRPPPSDAGESGDRRMRNNSSTQFDSTRYDAARDSDFWSDGPPAAQTSLPATQATPARGRATKAADPMDRLRRLLRGRFTLAVVVAVVGALLGAALGWMSQKPMYEASGSALIPQSVPEIGGGESGNANYRGFMATEAKFAQSEQMAEAAMRKDAWTDVVKQPWPAAVFANAANAGHGGNDALLRFAFKSTDPQIALAGTRALMAAYKDYFEERLQRVSSARNDQISPRLEKLRAKADEIQSQITEITQKWGTDNLLAVQGDKLNGRGAAQGRVNDLAMDLDQARAAYDRAMANPDSISPEMMAKYNKDIAVLLDQRAKLADAMKALTDTGFGMSHSQVKLLNIQAQDLNAKIDALTKQYRGEFYGEVPVLGAAAGSEGSVRPVTASYINSLDTRLSNARETYARLDKDVEDVQKDAQTLEMLKNRQSSNGDLRNSLQATLDRDQQQSGFRELVGTITPYPPSDAGVYVARDKRGAMAAAGGVLGFGIPLGLVLLMGFMDKRFRYSDDAGESATGAPLLGILPNLPDRLSDPNQASIAAHCVHQIRTMLQINHGSDEPRAFAVTSAQRGDGKTSLALALGLSYAASGARTLLVDTDLQGGGLSHRLGVGGDEGIMDALTGGDLLKFVCETDVTDLSILPIGRAAANHAGAFSPGAVRHLVEQAKRHYDVIVCDTGPILGSIEATPIASAMDGVLLAVSRGQDRTHVAKALTHLETVGANVSGTVFNRAQASDFERSVSGMNLRGNAKSNAAGKQSNVTANGRARTLTKA